MDKGTRNALGIDSKGRLHGAPALELLLKDALSAPEGKTPGGYFNNWDGADAAIKRAEPEVKDAALRYLLGVRMFELEASGPQIAVRNIKIGDVIRSSETNLPVGVYEIINPEKKAITLNVRWGSPRTGICYDTYIMNRDIMVPLVSRSA